MGICRRTAIHLFSSSVIAPTHPHAGSPTPSTSAASALDFISLAMQLLCGGLVHCDVRTRHLHPQSCYRLPHSAGNPFVHNHNSVRLPNASQDLPVEAELDGRFYSLSPSFFTPCLMLFYRQVFYPPVRVANFAPSSAKCPRRSFGNARTLRSHLERSNE